MKGKLILLVIILYTAISRFFLISKIPPMLDPSIINLRIFSAFLSLVSTILLFYIIKTHWQNTKVALLSSWVFSILPWVFEQGRIVSGPNYALSLLLIVAFLLQKIKPNWKYTLLLLVPILLYISYPQFWLFKFTQFKFDPLSFMTNFFILTSLDFLFFKNITFWWGGIREFGVMFLSMLPFFLIGIYELCVSNGRRLLLLLGLIELIAILSPFFPESREFYLVTPVFALVVALGIYKLMLNKNKAIKTFVICSFLLLVYESSQFFHFYFIHYPQQIMGNSSQIHEAF